MTTPAMTWDEAIATVTAPGGRYGLTTVTVDGRPYQVFEKAPPSLRELFDRCRGRDGTFLVYEDERWTFERFVTEMDALAAALVGDVGVQPGDRVAIAMRNYPEWAVAFGAAVSVGAVAVCLNAWWTGEELWYGLEDSGARVLVADAERAERAHGAASSLGVAVVAVRAEGVDLPGVRSWDEVVRARIERGQATMPDVELAPDDDATILYTSGTTGHPKGAVSTHRAVLSGLLFYGCRARVNATMSGPSEPHPYPTSFILAVPLFHVTGLIPIFLNCVLGGFKLVVMYKWNPERALELIERERVTQFVGVPTMSWDMLESPDFATRDTSSLVAVGGGGAPAPPELVQRVERSFTKGRPTIGYGMTETNGYGPQNAGDDYVRKPRSAGRALPMMEVSIRGEQFEELPVGEIGEICFRGPNLFRGYWNKPEATAEVMVDGWLRSGDLGRVDEEGFIFVEDRVKDMVLRGGENVYCAEVEAVVYEHPAVYECAVFGLPHDRLGEEVAVAVLPRAGMTIEADELQAHVAAHLAPFKVPTIVVVRDEPLPRGATGKILKRELRDELAC